MAQEVTDKPAEVGIKLNNILTAMILMVMVWVGASIESIKSDIKDVTALQMVNGTEIVNLKARLHRVESAVFK